MKKMKKNKKCEIRDCGNIADKMYKNKYVCHWCFDELKFIDELKVKDLQPPLPSKIKRKFVMDYQILLILLIYSVGFIRLIKFNDTSYILILLITLVLLWFRLREKDAIKKN